MNTMNIQLQTTRLSDIQVSEIKDYKLVISIPTPNPEDEGEESANIIKITENGVTLSKYIKQFGTDFISHADLYKMLLMGWAYLIC